MRHPKIGLAVNFGEGVRAGGGIMAWGRGRGQKFDCNIPRKFCVDISIRSVSGRGDQEGGVLGRC